jgi:hypothetical protein
MTKPSQLFISKRHFIGAKSGELVQKALSSRTVMDQKYHKNDNYYTIECLNDRYKLAGVLLGVNQLPTLGGMRVA